MENVRKFEYRPSRMKLGFAVDFNVSGETLHGMCVDVSDTGVRAEFDGFLTVGTTGMLILRHPLEVLRLKAEVAYVEKNQVGLVFLCNTPMECAVTTQFIAGIANYAVLPKSKYHHPKG